MIFVFCAAIIFGFVHPGSKFLLSSGIDLVSFCLLYIGIRLAVQIPVIVKTGGLRVATKKQGLILFSIGIVGAALQMTEFMGIADGLPVPVVTFLVYTHPVWTIILGRIINGEQITGVSVTKLALGIAGSAFIFLTQLQHISVNLHLLIAPMVAGLMIALWISLSGKAKKENIGTWTISFYYDLFAFSTLMALRASGLIKTMPTSEVFELLKEPRFISGMVAYSILIGLLPNLLFYRGSKNTSALAAGLILLLEPVVATLSSSLLWNLTLPPLFVLGAGLVLLSGAPVEEIPFSKLAAQFKGLSLKQAAQKALFLFILIVALPCDAALKPRVLHIWEVVPSDEGDYTNSKELKSIDIASDFAVSDFKVKNPDCAFTVDKSLSRGSEEVLFEKVALIAKSTTDAEIVVGMTRSSFARVAATAAKGSKLRAISIGAATANLADINKNFVSVAAPWTSQWEVLESDLTRSQCSKGNTFGFFDSNDYLSRQFQGAFESKFGRDQSFSIGNFDSSIKKIVGNKPCIFLAVNFSKAQMPLTKLAKENRKLKIVGIGDWNYYAPELRALLANTSQPWDVSVPTGWTPTVTEKSKAFSKRFEIAMKEEASPVAAYTYDATTMGLHALCENVEPNTFSVQTFKKLPNLLRAYQGLAGSNNFKSPMQVVKFNEAR